ncbi:MAG: hypothetical protein ACRD1H_13935 [Vicinamibacterales bacterium]
MQALQLIDVAIDTGIFQLTELAQNLVQLARIQILLAEQVAQLAAFTYPAARFVAELPDFIGAEPLSRPTAAPTARTITPGAIGIAALHAARVATPIGAATLALLSLLSLLALLSRLPLLALATLLRLLVLAFAALLSLLALPPLAGTCIGALLHPAPERLHPARQFTGTLERVRIPVAAIGPECGGGFLELASYTVDVGFELLLERARILLQLGAVRADYLP